MKKFVILAVFVVGLCVTVTLTGCPSSSPVHKASVAAASIGDSLQSAATVNHQMIQAGEESAQEGAQVAGYIDQAAKANDAFVKVLQATPDSGTTLTAQQVLSAFSVLQVQIATLNSQGVLHLKSAKAQQAFASAMATIQASIAAIEVVVAATSSQNHRPWPASYPLLGLALTPVEIEELIALAIAAGSSLVSKLVQLRGETDSQLQATALAGDAAAEQQAEADEKL
jgi:hypothetical protein